MIIQTATKLLGFNITSVGMKGDLSLHIRVKSIDN